MRPIYLLHSQVITPKERSNIERVLNAHGFSSVDAPHPECKDVAVFGIASHKIGTDVGREAVRLAQSGCSVHRVYLKERMLTKLHGWERSDTELSVLGIYQTLAFENEKIERLRCNGYQEKDLPDRAVKMHLKMYQALEPFSMTKLKDVLAHDIDWSVPSHIVGMDWATFALDKKACNWEYQMDKVLSLLLAKGVRPEGFNEKGESALMIACRSHTEAVVQMLLDHGADPNAVDLDGWTALMRVTMLSLAHKNHGFTPSPIKDQQCARLAKMLIAAGADVNHRPAHSRNSALRLAASKGLMEMCDVLVKAGADITLRDSKNARPSANARDAGHIECAVMLEEIEAVADAHTDLHVQTVELSQQAAPVRRSRL